MENDAFLGEEYDDFGFNVEPDWVEKSANCFPAVVKDFLVQGNTKQRKARCGVILSCSLFCTLLFLLIFSSIMIAILVGDSSPEENYPDIPRTFVTEFSEEIKLYGSLFSSFDGHMWSDYETKSSRVDYTTFESNPQYSHLISRYMYEDNGSIINNGVCRESPQLYNDIFSFVSHSDYEGDVVLDEETYQVYTYSSRTSESQEISFVLFADGNLPVFLNFTMSSQGTEEIELESFVHFTNFAGEAFLPDMIFATPPECSDNGYTCEGEAQTQEELDLLFFDAMPSISLDNQNGYDILGAAAKLCTSDHREWNFIHFYRLNVSSLWGQYGICDGTQCKGGNDDTVGRAASLKVKEMEGQCSDNSDVGNWYSFLLGAQCMDEQYVGEGCSWESISALEMISMDCLVATGFMESCAQYPDLPYTNPAAILENALTSCSAESKEKAFSPLFSDLFLSLPFPHMTLLENHE